MASAISIQPYRLHIIPSVMPVPTHVRLHWYLWAVESLLLVMVHKTETIQLQSEPMMNLWAWHLEKNIQYCLLCILGIDAGG